MCSLDLNPSQFSINSKRALYWRCPESESDLTKRDHSWHCSVHDMIYLYHGECPYCSNLLILTEEKERVPKSNGVSNEKNKKRRTHNTGKRPYRIIDVDLVINEMNRVICFDCLDN